MSVSVRNLSKVYGEQKAVNNISFEAKKGEILGFLGPNGAGKTTSMKIITCFIPATSGKVEVCGFDTEQQSIEVRKRIGYLPEHNPLYMDMYIKEYLYFVAGLHKIPNKKKAVEEMIERTGLGREQHKHIRSLSKGYRQRVGLAQAMIHQPEVLILDEPTSGLDPNQLVDIRKLIKELGEEKTVIFSSHIMQEVQALCDRVIILDKGNMVVNDTIAQLKKNVELELELIVEFNKAVDVEQLKKLKGVERIEVLGEGRYRIISLKEEDIRERIFNFAVREQLILLEMQRSTQSIEDIFQKVTA